MSEIRIPDIVWRWGSAAAQGKKPLRIELFSAEQFRHNWNPHKRTMHPHPPLRTREYWQQYYRLRVDGKWVGTPIRLGQELESVSKIQLYKYEFFTLEQAVQLADRLFRERT